MQVPLRLPRLLVSVMLAAVSVGLMLSTPASATPTIGLDGPVTIVDHFTFGDGCAFVHGLWDGSFRPNPGPPWNVHVDECTVDSGENLVLAGHFTLTAPGGSLKGTISGDQPFGGGTYTVDVTRGTKRFHGASGSLLLSGTWDTSNFGAFVLTGTLSGQLTRSAP
jgi:hypothetical protein